jgi:hypothetical protein
MDASIRDFLTLLESSASPNDITASCTLSSLRATDLPTFLSFLLAILESNFSTIATQLSLIHAAKAFNSLTNAAFLERARPGILSEFLSAAQAHFVSFPDLSAPLFAAVVNVILASDGSSVIVSDFVAQLRSVSELSFLRAGYRALSFICEENGLAVDQVHSVLEAAFLVLVDIEMPGSLRAECLRLVFALLPAMSDVLEAESNASTTLNVLVFSLGADDTKTVAYRCLGRLARRYYGVFAGRAAEVVGQAVRDLTEGADEGVIIAVCQLFQKIARAERDFEDGIDITTAVFPAVIEVLLLITAANRSPLPDEDDAYDQFVAAREAILEMARAFPSEFVISLARSQIGADVPACREIAVGLLALAECQGEAAMVLPRVLADPAPRVRRVAVRDLATALATHVPDLLMQVLPLIGDPESELVSLGACDFLIALAEKGAVPAFDQIIDRYFAVIGSIDDRVSARLSAAICQVTRRAKDAELVRKSAGRVTTLLSQTFTDPTLRRHSRDIVDVFCGFCNSAAGREFHSAALTLLPVLIGAFDDPEADTGLLLAVACLAKVVAGVDFRAFERFLPRTMELVVAMIQRGDLEAVSDGCEVVGELLPMYDLADFLPTIGGALADAVESDDRHFQAGAKLFAAILRVQWAGQSEAVRRFAELAKSVVSDRERIAADLELCQAMLEFFHELLIGPTGEVPEWIEFAFELTISAASHLEREEGAEVRDAAGALFKQLAELNGEAMVAFLADECARRVARELVETSKWRREIRTALQNIGVDRDCLE